MTDLEELCNSISVYDEFTLNFYDIYKKNPNYSYDYLLKMTLRNKQKNWSKTYNKANKMILMESYLSLVSENKLAASETFRKLLIRKPGRSLRGILNVTVMTSPEPEYIDENGENQIQKFTCEHNCYFCPHEKDENGKELMPRSYLRKEPACQRAERNKFDPIDQTYDRLKAYEKMGHPIDKIELIVLGGTVLEYPRQYLTWFTTQCFYSCNTYPYKNSRKMLSLEEEQKINETSNVRIIGYTLETRPDGITDESVYFLRNLGVTRMQIGIQHTSNRILKKVNRGHTIEDSMKAIRILNDSGLKIIAHLMPDLPFVTKEEDIEMFNEILYNQLLLCDEYKVYPCVATDHTVIKKWAEQGKYKHQVDVDPNYLQEVIGDFMKKVKPWVRVPRIIRDIPNDYIHYGNKEGHLREKINNTVESQEIRGREIMNTKLTKYPIMKVDKFMSSNRTEYFIRYVTNTVFEKDSKILGFCRLRLNHCTNQYLPELHGKCAVIRELHVYGKTTVVNSLVKEGVQHLGLGQKLVRKAEQIAFLNGFEEIAITSGIGVRNYYRNKLGYELDGLYMKKNLILIYLPMILLLILMILIMISGICIIYN